MINLDFGFGVSLYLFLCLAIVCLAWYLTRRSRDKDLSLDPRYIWHCSVCTYTYVNTKEEALSVCPRCGSYNKKSAE